MIKGNVKTKIDALIWKDAEPGRNVAAAAAEYEISPAGLYNAIDVLKGLGVSAAEFRQGGMEADELRAASEAVLHGAHGGGATEQHLRLLLITLNIQIR